MRSTMLVDLYGFENWIKLLSINKRNYGVLIKGIMEWIVQIVTEKSVRKVVGRYNKERELRDLIIYILYIYININICCDLLLDDGWTSRTAG